MAQESLARRLGVKPQQVQRYEATEYGSASFARILKVVQALGLSMARAGTTRSQPLRRSYRTKITAIYG
jgi:transcriptional regulator with XRE-family HTH domain